MHFSFVSFFLCVLSRQHLAIDFILFVYILHKLCFPRFIHFVTFQRLTLTCLIVVGGGGGKLRFLDNFITPYNVFVFGLLISEYAIHFNLLYHTQRPLPPVTIRNVRVKAILLHTFFV